MKKFLLLWSMLFVLGGYENTAQETAYQQITAEDAKQMMDELENEIILDMREQGEYDAGHITGAVLLPVGMIAEDTANAVIPEKIKWCWCIAEAVTAAKQLLRRWLIWDIRRCTNSVELGIGSMK